MQGSSTADAVRLLDALLVDLPGAAVVSGGASELIAHDRDRLLASVYVRNFGLTVESTVNCTACDEAFDLSFNLKELEDDIVSDGAEIEAEEDGSFRLPSGLQFRLPRGEDEISVQALPIDEAAAALLRKCLADGGKLNGEGEELQLAMEAIAPVMDLALSASCPECGHIENMQFDLQHYLLTLLLQARERLLHEIHRLATAYGWGLNEILGLPRSQRQLLVRLVEDDYGARP